MATARVYPALTSSPASWTTDSDRTASDADRLTLPGTASTLPTTMRAPITQRILFAVVLTAAAALVAGALAGGSAAAPGRAVQVTFVGDSVPASIIYTPHAQAILSRGARSPARPAGVPPARDGELQLPGIGTLDRAPVRAVGRCRTRRRPDRRRRLQRVGSRVSAGDRPDHAQPPARRARAGSSG